MWKHGKREFDNLTICKNAKNDLRGQTDNSFINGIKFLHSACYTSVLSVVSAVNKN